MTRKILMAVITTLSITVCLMGIFTFYNSRNLYYKVMEKDLTRSVDLVSKEISSKDEFYSPDIAESIKIIANTTEQRITLIDLTGEVVFDTELNASELGNHLNRPEVQNALKGVLKREIRFSSSTALDMMYIAKKITISGGETGIIRSSISLNLMKDILNQSLENVIGYLGVFLILAALLSRYIIKSLMTPISDIAVFAKKIAGGNYKERMTSFKKDEIGELTRSLNNMADSLEDSFCQLSDRNAELESILKNIVNGIIAIDGKNNIKMINKSAYKMLNIPEDRNVVNKNIIEVIRNHSLYEMVTEITGYPEDSILENTRELVIGENIFRITISQIIDSHIVSGYIIVLQDITQIRKLESMRKDFVANVSHELKTPITSIKGFIETLKDGGVEDEETRNRFYEIISLETDRLIKLVEDILTMSFLDNENNIGTMDKEKLNPVEEIRKVIYLLHKEADKKHLGMEVHAEETVPYITFNRNYFKQMMMNLISNAIKYSRENGTVVVNIRKENSKLIIEVSDNGIGIPEKDLFRIFERFYRVDKGRAREEGGTGLGLAIVKHILQTHNGDIQVKSEVNKGTIFTITLNAA
ncbi:MAG: cell wall metabolism sensor histidine kinase WalK [Eubacteriaceae bacterium]|nr:cell wall metabolism sensor histidine kinase WalK [Eubacteriaceae bacterium]